MSKMRFCDDIVDFVNFLKQFGRRALEKYVISIFFASKIANLAKID